MRVLLAAALYVATAAVAPQARADCAADIDRALPMARALPDPKGRGAILENIERARVSRHEGDEDGCREQMQEVLAMLCPPAPKPGAKNQRRASEACGK